jgi:hypothetical protein
MASGTFILLGVRLLAPLKRNLAGGIADRRGG